MKILVRSAKIIDPSSPHHKKVMDVVVDNGSISSIVKNASAKGIDEVIEGDDLHISVGWVDMFAAFGDPGTEYKEDISSGLNAAGSGGFSKVAISPATNPVVDSKSGIEYLLKKAAGHTVDVIPIGAMTKKLEGKEISEMFDMKQAGAKAISNGKHSLEDAKLQNLSLLYSRNLDLPIYSFALDSRMSNGGQMHEGEVSTRMGLKGIPALAEELVVSRDLYLAEYSNVPIHFSHVTSKGSVDLIRTAKKKGLRVTASVPAHHLLLNHELTEDFDGNSKVIPPFRDDMHIKALVKGLKNGTLDAIISDHEPQEIEAKFSEFTRAEFGIIALETAFSISLQALKDQMELEDIIHKFTVGPRAILKIEQPSIKKGNGAELTVFSPSIEWTVNSEEIRSLSKNTPLIGKQVLGLPIAVINNNQLFLNV